MDSQIQKIIAQINDHENRLRALEGTNPDIQNNNLPKSSNKQRTLREIVKGKNIKNGQEKVAVIVGYLEKIDNKSKISQGDIKQGWRDGKFDGYYDKSFLKRGLKDALIRDLKDDTYDLTQTGEKFFEKFLNESEN